MDDKPPRRRWFQFKLSTWFVLVGILAWAMIYWPWVTTTVGWIPPQKKAPRNFLHSPYAHVPLEMVETRSLHPALRYPTLFLLGFLGWKTVWLVVERRRARKLTATGLVSTPRGD